MDIDIIKGQECIMKLSGRLDTPAASELSDAIAEIIEDNNNIIIDCDELEYVSSSGLRVLLQTLKSLDSTGGSLRLTNVQPAVQSVLDLTGFSLFLKFEDKRND